MSGTWVFSILENLHRPINFAVLSLISILPTRFNDKTREKTSSKGQEMIPEVHNQSIM